MPLRNAACIGLTPSRRLEARPELTKLVHASEVYGLDARLGEPEGFGAASTWDNRQLMLTVDDSHTRQSGNVPARLGARDSSHAIFDAFTW